MIKIPTVQGHLRLKMQLVIYFQYISNADLLTSCTLGLLLPEGPPDGVRVQRPGELCRVPEDDDHGRSTPTILHRTLLLWWWTERKSERTCAVN